MSGQRRYLRKLDQHNTPGLREFERRQKRGPDIGPFANDDNLI